MKIVEIIVGIILMALCLLFTYAFCVIANEDFEEKKKRKGKK